MFPALVTQWIVQYRYDTLDEHNINWNFSTTGPAVPKIQHSKVDHCIPVVLVPNPQVAFDWKQTCDLFIQSSFKIVVVLATKKNNMGVTKV